MGGSNIRPMIRSKIEPRTDIRRPLHGKIRFYFLFSRVSLCCKTGRRGRRHLRDFRIFRAFRLPIRLTNAKRGLASPFCVGLPDRIRTCDLKSRSLARYPAEPRADDLHPLLYTDFPAVSIQNRVYFLRPQKRRNVTRQALRTPRVCREVSKAAYAEAPPGRPTVKKPLPT